VESGRFVAVAMASQGGQDIEDSLTTTPYCS
jgi:hypothetical protein